MNKKLGMHTTSASSKRALFDKTYIGSIEKIQIQILEFLWGSMPSDALERPRILLAAARLDFFKKHCLSLNFR